MTSKYVSTYVRIALVAAAAGVMVACAPVRHHPEPDPYYAPRAAYYDYWYYPAIGCYYDPRAHIYIYYEHDHWVRARALPARVRPYIGTHVTVRSPHERPYQEHHRHREQYVPERYRKPDPARRGDDIWIGTPRRPSPPHDRDDRRPDNDSRDRNDRELRYDPKGDNRPRQQDYRERASQPPRQVPDARYQDAPGHREPPATAAPIERDNYGRQREIQREDSHEPYRSRDDQREHRDNARPIDPDDSRARPVPPGQYRAPAAHDQRRRPDTQPRDVPRRDQPAGVTAPVPKDTGHAPETRKEDAPDRAHEREDWRDNDSQTDDDDSGPRDRRYYPEDTDRRYR